MVRVETATSASFAQRRSMVMVVRPPSGRNLPAMRGGPWWRLRQPSCQTFARSVHRRFEPVSSISRASAKEDLPEPLRPTTRVRPGEGSRVSATGGPIPLNPSTSMAARYVAVGACSGSGGLTEAFSRPSRVTRSASGPWKAARTRSAAPSTVGGASARRVPTRFWRVRSAIWPGSLAEVVARRQSVGRPCSGGSARAGSWPGSATKQ